MKKGKIYVLLAVLMVSAFASLPANVMAGEKDDTMFYGCGYLVHDLDPQHAWDSASIDVIDQVCEGLFGYNLSDPELAIVPVLSKDMGTWNNEATELTLTLKEGVTFHDGTTFTSADVVYTFDRLNALMEDGLTQIAELYEPMPDPANTTHNVPLAVVKTIEANGDYEVKFTLNYPYAPFVPLLCFSGSVILPEDEYPDDALMSITDVLVGTGPYTYIEQTEEYTSLVAYDGWHGTFPENYFEKVTFLLYSDGTAKNQAYLSGEIDWIDGTLSEFQDQYNESVYHVLGDQRQGTSVYYMGMNTKQIDIVMREAISYAMDYEYVLAELGLGNLDRMTSVVPKGIMYHVDDLDVPEYDLNYSRWLLRENGKVPIDTNLTDDEWWQGKAMSSNPVATYNYTWNTGNEMRADIGILAMNNLRDIGINIFLTGMTWGEYLDKLYGYPDQLQLYMLGWGADYNDPSNFINPLFSNTSAANGAQFNEPDVQDLMMEGLTVTDDDDRRVIYEEIQHLIVETYMPWCLMYVPFGRGVTSVTFGGNLRNPMGKLWFASMYWTGEAGPGTTGGIPGYSFIGMIGAAAIALGVIYKKRK